MFNNCYICKKCGANSGCCNCNCGYICCKSGPQGVPGPMGPTGATGIAGPTGPTGPTGEAQFVSGFLPFSVGKYPNYFQISQSGEPIDVHFETFSSGGTGLQIMVDPNDWNAGIIIPQDEYGYVNFFVVPRDIIISSIHLQFANVEIFELYDNEILKPLVALATLDTTTKIFTIIPQTKFYTQPYVAAESPVPSLSFREGVITNLSLSIPEGTILVIVLAAEGENLTEEKYITATAGGGIAFE